MLLEAYKSLNSYGITSEQTDDFIVYLKVSYQEVIDGNLVYKAYTYLTLFILLINQVINIQVVQIKAIATIKEKHIVLVV